MKQSRGVFSEKERLSHLIKKIANRCKSLSELADELQENHLQPYYRNDKLTGVIIGKRKLRLTTLGIDKTHLKTLTIEQERIDSLESKSHDTELEQ